MRSRPGRTRRPLVALLALLVALVVGYAVRSAESHDASPGPSTSVGASAGTSASASSADGTVALSALPPQVAATLRLIDSHGPFPFPRNDGVVFHNYEHVLPREADGYYHEYTVPTPGSGDRGARRLVTGRAGQYFYTGDHYATFRRVDVGR